MKHRILFCAVALFACVGTICAEGLSSSFAPAPAIQQSDDSYAVMNALWSMWSQPDAYSPEFRELLDEDRAICDKYDLIPCVEFDLWSHNMGACPEDSVVMLKVTDLSEMKASVHVKVINCGGETIEVFKLIKIDGQWRVDDIVVDGVSDKQELMSCLQEVKQHLPTLDGIVYVTGNSVRLRWSPEIKNNNIVLDEHSRTKHFNKGDQFKYLADAGDFYEVSYNGVQAYISKQFSRLEYNQDSQPQQNAGDIRNSYISILNNFCNHYQTRYVSDCGYFLYDITGDGIPELWVNYGTCEADYQLDVYTCIGGKASLLLNTGYSHSYCCRGNGYVLIVMAHMGYADWRKLTYNGGVISERRVFSEEDVDDYTNPSEPMINPYFCSNLEPIYSQIK